MWWHQKEGAVPNMQTPISVIALTEGYQPYQIALGNDTRGYNWTIELPAGRQYILTMNDANGYTGGNSFVLDVADSPVGVNCSTNTLTPNNLTLSVSSSFAECSSMIVKASGGTAPYTMQILAASRPAKTTTWTTSTMSYTIDMGASEQFFVHVKDAAGKIALDGLYEVGVGDTACYEVATTVTSGNLPTTLSYDPTSTVSIPARSSTGPVGPGVLQNTATTTATTVVTFRDGSISTYTLAPNASITVEDHTGSNSTDKKVDLPVIVGGAVGGVAFVVLILFILFFLKRRASKRRQMLSDRPDMMGATHSGGVPPHLTTPGREQAPLMVHGDSMYSAATATTLSPGLTYGTQKPWPIPDPDSVQPKPTPIPTSHAYSNTAHNTHTHHNSTSGGSRQSLAASMNNRSDTGLPPGAGAPVRMGSTSSNIQGTKLPKINLTDSVGQEGQAGKASFISPAIIKAPPSYSGAHAYRL
ncbi:hypothetical protein CPB86DRAFT_781264 [Serendipita vermifera]|nr:hypothetical protein CPB86DRAFT_781264 [Serendipita vermifera]